LWTRRDNIHALRCATAFLPMPKPSDATPRTYETALAELETIVATMEAGQLPLADSLAAFKRGAELLQYCQAALKDAQQQVQVLEKGVLRAFTPERVDADVGDEP
jgi:exodeoxyribonuclease VII small subunit